MSVKERFESHPVIWGLTMIVVGFVAGFGARGYVIPAPEQPAPATATCSVEGLESVEEAHSLRVRALHSQLVELETKASDHNLASAYQTKYLEAAQRLRADIGVENGQYQSTIESLRAKCE